MQLLAEDLHGGLPGLNGRMIRKLSIHLCNLRNLRDTNCVAIRRRRSGEFGEWGIEALIMEKPKLLLCRLTNNDWLTSLTLNTKETHAENFTCNYSYSYFN